MNRNSVVEMNVAEETHWWYAGLQDFLRRIVRSLRPRIGADCSVLDVGCGTGANLRVLRDCLRPGYLGGFDVRPDCVARAAAKCPEADVYLSDIRRPELHRAAYDLVVCCDVLSDIGAGDCRDGLRTIAERIAPGGRLIVHVPACSWLSSQHDAAVGTRHRFHSAELADRCRDSGLDVERIGYRMSLLFPFVAASRWLFRSTADAPQSDLRRRAGSAFFHKIVQFENAAAVHGFCGPIGSSLFVVARKPNREASIDSRAGLTRAPTRFSHFKNNTTSERETRSAIATSWPSASSAVMRHDVVFQILHSRSVNSGCQSIQGIQTCEM